MFHDHSPPFALVSQPTQDLLTALQVAAFSDRWPAAHCADLAMEALAGGAAHDPPPPVKDSPLVLLAHAWGRGSDYRKALSPLVKPLTLHSGPRVRDRALGVLIHAMRRRTKFMEQLLTVGARAQDWMLQAWALSLPDITDQAARNQLRLYEACGWSPSGAPQEDPTLLAMIKARRPSVLEEWLRIHAAADQMLPINPNGNGLDPLEVVLSQRTRASTSREIEKCDTMILSLAHSGLLQPSTRATPLEPWITQALVEGERLRLERQTSLSPTSHPPRMRL